MICISKYVYIYDYVQEGCLHLPVVVLNACHMHCSPKPQESETRHVTGFPKEKTLYTKNNKSNIGRQQFQEWTHTHNSNNIPKQNHLLEKSAQKITHTRNTKTCIIPNIFFLQYLSDRKKTWLTNRSILSQKQHPEKIEK